MMDHERVNISNSPMSCGILELSRIGEDIDGVLYSLGSRLYHPSRGDPAACFMFSDINTVPSNSFNLIKRVADLKLGKTHTSVVMENPRTGNMIVIYTWIIDHTKFKKYYSQQRVKKLAKVGR